jgi:parvulin-like peptidyl-prolyl isomerase
VKRLIPLVIALAVIASACGGGSGDVAATVNSDEITSSDVDALVGPDVDATPEIQAQALTTLISWVATEQAAEEQFDFAPTEEDIDAQADLVVQGAGAESLEQIAETEGVPVDLLRRYIVQLMTRDAVTTALESTVPSPTDAEVATQLTDFRSDWTTVCVSHLLVATSDEADDAIARIDGGEDFGTVASDVSTDTASAIQGGDLGCTSASDYVDEFAQAAMEAPIGVVTGPVESQFGFHVLVVNQREEATEDDVRTALTEQALQTAADEWYLDVLDTAEVDVSPDYGTWTTDPTPQVVAASVDS